MLIKRITHFSGLMVTIVSHTNITQVKNKIPNTCGIVKKAVYKYLIKRQKINDYLMNLIISNLVKISDLSTENRIVTLIVTQKR